MVWKEPTPPSFSRWIRDSLYFLNVEKSSPTLLMVFGAHFVLYVKGKKNILAKATYLFIQLFFIIHFAFTPLNFFNFVNISVTFLSLLVCCT